MRTCTRLRSAIFISTVPPPALNVAEATTCPRSTPFWMMMPVIGARTSVSSSEIWLFSISMRRWTAEALALA